MIRLALPVLSPILLMAACAASANSPPPINVDEVIVHVRERAVTDKDGHGADHVSEFKVYDASRDAAADVEAALAKVSGTTRKVIVAMGGNWCHDSRGFAEHLSRPDIAPIVTEHFEVVYVDVGIPQRDQPRNEALAERFGVAPIVGTPTVVVLDSQGRVLNAETAPTWRNAHSRIAGDVAAELRALAAIETRVEESVSSP